MRFGQGFKPLPAANGGVGRLVRRVQVKAGLKDDVKMFLRDVVSRDALPALEKTLAFTEARQRVLAENVANADTPGYRPRHVDTGGFQNALRKAVDASRKTGTFTLKNGPGFRIDRSGRLALTPADEPSEVLSSEQDKPRIEQQMAMLAENAMMHQTAAELLRTKFEGLLKAIRGGTRLGG